MLRLSLPEGMNCRRRPQFGQRMRVEESALIMVKRVMGALQTGHRFMVILARLIKCRLLDEARLL